ncbi:hypothetical protein O4H26_05400 [Aequorivita viscosa]|nr:hypothetical protein [Aequorivita viscosa]
MWQKLFLTICIGTSGILFSQDSGVRGAIAMEFPAPSIAAFQESSQTKIYDFYNYLGLLTTPKLSNNLKTQIRENIYTLFRDTNINIPDPTSENPDKMTLQQLLDAMEKHSKTTFTVVGMQSFPVTFEDYWVNTYTLEIKTGTQKTTKNLQQKIYFHPEQKTFGSTTKEVWTLKLGEVSTLN